MTVNPLNVRQEFLPDEVLKIEVETDSEIKNLVPNSSGVGGAWGWSTPNPNTSLEQVFADSARAVTLMEMQRVTSGRVRIRIAGQRNRIRQFDISNNPYLPDGSYATITQTTWNLGGVVGYVTDLFIADFETVLANETLDNTGVIYLPNELQFTTTTSQVAYTDTTWFKVTTGQYLQARLDITAITATTSISMQLMYRDANGNAVGLGNSSNARSTSGTVFFGAYQVPPTAVEAKLRITIYGSTASGTTTPAAANAYVCFTQVQVIQTASSTTPQTRRNLALNPNLESNLDGCTSPIGNTITRATDQKWQGTYSAKYATTSTSKLWARFFHYSNGTVATTIATNTPHMLSFYARSSIKRDVKISVLLGTAAGAATSSDITVEKTVTLPISTWTRVSIPFNSGSKTKLKYFSVTGLEAGSTYWFDGFLLEAGTTELRPYFDGSNIPESGWTSSWDGSTNASRSTATGPAAQFNYVPPVTYQEITGSVVSYSSQRAGLETGTMQLSMSDVALDPASSDVLRKGRRIRVRSKNAGVYYDRFVGKINNAHVDYEPRKNKPLLTNISVTAIDAIADLANTKRANSVADITELTSLLEGQNVPWDINGENGQTLISPVTAGVNENASLLDQVALVRDTPRHATSEGPSYAFVSRSGALTVRSEDTQAARPVAAVLNEDDGDVFYNDQFKLSYDSSACINEVLIKAQRLTGSGENQQTEEWSYGPFRDQDSINKWGAHSKEFTVATSPSATIDTTGATYFANFIADIFARNSEPQMLMSSVQVPILNSAGIVFAGELDLYDKLNITNAEKAYDEIQNVVGINETITADRWIVDIFLSSETSVASPETQPDISVANVPPVGSTSIWGFTGTTTPPSFPHRESGGWSTTPIAGGNSNGSCGVEYTGNGVFTALVAGHYSFSYRTGVVGPNVGGVDTAIPANTRLICFAWHNLASGSVSTGNGYIREEEQVTESVAGWQIDVTGTIYLEAGQTMQFGWWSDVAGVKSVATSGTGMNFGGTSYSRMFTFTRLGG